MTLVLEETQVKELFKQAVTEVLRERRDLLYDIFAEVMEDIALTKAGGVHLSQDGVENGHSIPAN